jgi:hypothetical protein
MLPYCIHPMDPNAALKWLVYAIILFKVCFIVGLCTNLWYMHARHENNGTVIKLKEMFESGYMFLMGILLMFLFYPRAANKQYMTREMELLIYLFGIITIFMRLHYVVSGQYA